MAEKAHRDNPPCNRDAAKLFSGPWRPWTALDLQLRSSPTASVWLNRVNLVLLRRRRRRSEWVWNLRFGHDGAIWAVPSSRSGPLISEPFQRIWSQGQEQSINRLLNYSNKKIIIIWRKKKMRMKEEEDEEINAMIWVGISINWNFIYLIIINK